jgi:hypothetical protein
MDRRDLLAIANLINLIEYCSKTLSPACGCTETCTLAS